MKTLVIDTRLMAYNLFHRDKDILNTTASVAYLWKDFFSKAPDKVIFAMDKGKSRRAEQFSEYKAHRKKRDSLRTKEYQDKLKKFNEDYNKLETYLEHFGNVVAIYGVEADDIASILTNSSLAEGNNEIILMSSDSDWVKFLGSHKNASILNPTKLKHITYEEVEAVYGYGPKEKLVMDCLTGVSKENVPGLVRFGPKTFKKIWEEYDGDEEAVIKAVASIYNGSSKIPEPFETVEEMYEFNKKLFRPWTIADLTSEEQDYLKKALTKTPDRNVSAILEDSLFLYSNMRMPSPAEIQIFKLD